MYCCRKNNLEEIQPQCSHLEYGVVSCSMEAVAQPQFLQFFSIPCSCNVFLDYLHIEYLGSDQYQCGGVLWLLCFVVKSSTPANNLHSIWSRMQFWHKKLQVQHKYHYFILFQPPHNVCEEGWGNEIERSRS